MKELQPLPAVPEAMGGASREEEARRSQLQRLWHHLELPSPDRAAGSTIASKEPAAQSKHLQQKPKLAKHSTDDELLARTNRFMVLADPDEPDEQESDDV